MSTRNAWTYTAAVLKKYLIGLVVGWLLIYTWFHFPMWVENRTAAIAAKAARLQRNADAVAMYTSDFGDYIHYRRLYSVMATVRPSTPVYMVSEYAVLKPSFWLQWSESLECARLDPDNHLIKLTNFSFYATGSITGKLMAEKSDYGLHYWVMREYRSPELDYTRPPSVVLYPPYSADCRVRSVMVQFHGTGGESVNKKTFEMYSEVVEVREKKSRAGNLSKEDAE